MRRNKVLIEEKCDKVWSLEVVKGKIVTAGSGVVFWENDLRVCTWDQFEQVSRVMYCDEMDMMFIGCWNGELWVIGMKGVRV